MHIPTHHDPIWQTDCQSQEDEIIQQLSGISNRVLVRPIDAVTINPADLNRYDMIVTDNRFIIQPTTAVVDLGPYIWGIYHMDPVVDDCDHPSKFYDCMMNRISGERLQMFYDLAERELLGYGHVSFNCLYHDRDPDQSQRQANYDRVREECGWTDREELHHRHRESMPLLLDLDPTQAALDSLFTLVVESYVSDWCIAVSEKIFRALQTPRPWALYASPGTVKMLRTVGFDVLDDQVQHWRYDNIKDPDQRRRAVINQISNHRFEHDRLVEASCHNSNLLRQLKQQLPDHVAHCRQSILDWHQAISN